MGASIVSWSKRGDPRLEDFRPSDMRTCPGAFRKNGTFGYVTALKVNPLGL